MPSTVVLGTGIIGLSTAYALALLTRDTDPAHAIHLVEPSPQLFASASGKAAGFLAKDWFGPAIAPLAALSFDLHRALAAQHNGRDRWGWSESVSYSLDRDAASAPPAHTGGVDWILTGESRATVLGGAEQEASAAPLGAAAAGPAWLRANIGALQAISARQSTGQVHPLRLCEFLLEQCTALGVSLHHPARATALIPGAAPALRLELLGRAPGTRTVPCDSLVLAAGCWTPHAYRALFPHARRVPRVAPLAGHSVVLRSARWQPAAGAPCAAVFTSDSPGFSPEVFSRAGGDVWLGGLNSAAIPLPALPTDAVVEPESVARLVGVAQALCGDDVEVLREGVCFRPVSSTGRPMIVRVPGADLGEGAEGVRVFLATAHGPWGISLSLGTGRVVAEMVLGREPSADVSALASWYD
ncbi:FAD dependent oxidoreductase [Sparassis latifolia]